MTQPKRQHPDPRSVPPLQIVQAPGLAGGVDDGATVRVSPAQGFRAGLIAIGVAAVIAGPVLLPENAHGSANAPAKRSLHVAARTAPAAHRLSMATLVVQLRK